MLSKCDAFFFQRTGAAAAATGGSAFAPGGDSDGGADEGGDDDSLGAAAPLVSPSMRKHLKTTFARRILELRDKFLAKEKKGKLPKEAVVLLKKCVHTSAIARPRDRGVILNRANLSREPTIN